MVWVIPLTSPDNFGINFLAAFYQDVKLIGGYYFSNAEIKSRPKHIKHAVRYKIGFEIMTINRSKPVLLIRI